jgi:hypothetical protein
MIDVEPLIQSSFDRIVPARPVDGDWADVLHRAGVRPRGRWLRPRRTALAFVLAALVVSAGGVAAVKELPWWQSGAPAVDPEAVVAVARDNMPADVRVAEARTVSTANDAALVAVPLDRSGYCVIPTLDGHAGFGAQCVDSVADPESGDGDTLASAVRPDGDGARGAWLVYGRITDPRAASLDLGPLAVELDDGGFFITRVPSGQWASLAGQATAARILDSTGATLRRLGVTWGQSPAGASAADASGFAWSSGAPVCRPQTRPAPPRVDYRQAKGLFAVRLTHDYSIWKPGDTVTFYEAPTSAGSPCVVPTGPGVTLAELAARPAGFGCNLRQPPTETEPMRAGLSAQLGHEDGRPVYVWDVSGWFDPRRVAAVKLRTPDGEVAASAADGFFFVQVPQTTPGPASSPAFPAGETLIGEDASGAEVARVDLDALYRQATPH